MVYFLYLSYGKLDDDNLDSMHKNGAIYLTRLSTWNIKEGDASNKLNVSSAS
jgi:hypothetical protein